MRGTAGALMLAGALGTASAQAQENYAVVGATIVTGTDAAPIADGVLVVRDGRIQCVGTRAQCSTQGVEVRPANGQWIIPGLIDAHMHYSQTGWADGRPDALDARAEYPYDGTIAALRDPTPFWRSYLCSGVTGTYDVGGYAWTWGLRARAEADASAPHVAAAGPLLSTRDHWLNVPGERQFLHIGSDSATVAGARYLLVNGTDAVKVWFLADADDEDADAMVTRLHMAADSARAHGTPLIVHATGLWEATHAVEAGAHLLVHGVDDRPVDEAFLSAARAAGTIYTPTLIVTDGYVQLSARNFDESLYGDDVRCVDPQTLEKVRRTNTWPGGATAEQTARMREYVARSRELQAANVRRVRDAGIPIAMGTDAGNPLTLHGPSVFVEMEALQAAGLTPHEVLIAATRTAARAMRRDADIGTLEAGKQADYVILTADPLADIANVREIASVTRAGRTLTRASLYYR